MSNNAENTNPNHKDFFPIFKVQYPAWSIIDFFIRIIAGLLTGMLFEVIGWNEWLGFFVGQILFAILIQFLFKTDEI